MKEYKVGEYYNFWVTGIGNANHRIYLKDDDDRRFTVYAYDFQTEWDWSSPQVPVQVLKCYVKEITDTGAVILEQSKDVLLIVLYPEAYKGESKICTFVVDSLKTINDTLYYVVSDAYGITHMFKPSALSPALQPGDEVQLNVTGYKQKENNRSCIYLSEVTTEENNAVAPAVPTATDEETPVGEFGEETDNREFKSTIIYPAGAIGADIDTQILVILKTIAGFMNADGGTLYIGIHDKTKQVMGIEQDLTHLCEGESAYADSYTADYDHYALKIRDTVVSLCSAMAGSLIKISFPSQDNITYCKIDISPAKRPIWTKGNMLFQRQGNQTQMLRGESLTQFVGERIGSYIIAMAGGNALQDISSEQMSAMIRSAVKTAINDRRLGVAAPVVQTNIEPKYWIVWYNDGTWSRVKNEQNGDNIFKQIPITEDAADVVVAFCHKSGTVNTVKLSDFKKKTKQGEINKNGYNPNEKPEEIYVCHPSSLIAVHSADQGGTEYIKMHHLTDFNPTASGRNQGSYIIPKNKGHVLEYKLVSPDQALALKALIFSKKETSQSFGLDWNNLNIQSEISALNQL